MRRVNEQLFMNDSGEMLDLVMKLLQGYRELLQQDPEYQADRIKEVDKVLLQYPRFKETCLNAGQSMKKAIRRFAVLSLSRSLT